MKNLMESKFTFSFLIVLLLGCPLLLMGQNDGLNKSHIEEIDYRNWITKKNKNQSSQKDKIALIIGNSRYSYNGQLKEPAKDANVMAEALRQQGYDIEIGYNLSKKKFNEAIDEFAEKLKDYNSCVVFYAGHGFQVAGENFLIPIDANPEDTRDVAIQCIKVNRIFEVINDVTLPKIVIMDACRNNPFNQLRDETRGRKPGMAAVKIQALRNSMVIFSTESNTVVKDNNPFAEIMADCIKKGGCFNDELLGEVAEKVIKSNPDQVIDRKGILTSSVCFGEKNQKDTDGDGIPDHNDNCPTEPGASMHYGCPDTDGDGLADDDDRCPSQQGPRANKGCPYPQTEIPKEFIPQGVDSDNDGIADDPDKCPDEYGLPDNNGCPPTLRKPYVGTFTDSRDGQTYQWVRLKDGKKWMAQNLNYAPKNDSWVYDDKKKNGKVHGRLYTWPAAQEVCPKGWRLPTEEDWNHLIHFYGGQQEAFLQLQEKGGNNFAATLSGYRKSDGKYFCMGQGGFGRYWSSTKEAATATAADFNDQNHDLSLSDADKYNACSCRCVQD